MVHISHGRDLGLLLDTFLPYVAMVGYELNTTDVLRHGSEMFLFCVKVHPLAMIFATYRVYKSTLPPRLFYVLPYSLHISPRHFAVHKVSSLSFRNSYLIFVTLRYLSKCEADSMDHTATAALDRVSLKAL